MQDRIWPDDYTYGFGGPPADQKLPKFVNFCENKAPPPSESLCPNARFDARRWCIEQVVAARAAAPHKDPQPLHIEARALFDFLFGGAA